MSDPKSLYSLELTYLTRQVEELQKRENRLRTNYEELKRLYEVAPLAYQSLDMDGRFVEVNQTWLETLGYVKEEVIGRNFVDFLHPDGRDNFRENFLRFKEVGEVFGVEFEMVKKNGSLIHALFQGKISEDPVRKIRHTHCIFHDLTKRQQAEAALQEGEERIKALYRSTSGGILIHEERVILECNQGVSELSGYAYEELIGMDGIMLIASDYHDLVLQNLQRNFKPTYEVVGLRKDGTRFPVRVRSTNIPYKGRTVQLTEILDITDYKQMEEVLENDPATRAFPLAWANGITFQDLFDLPVIQRFQDEFAAATGVASLITHPNGTPITAPSNFTRLCGEIIRKTELGCSNCFKSDAAIGSYHPSGPIIQPCLSGGLWDAGARITISGQHIANWLIGQVRNEAQNDKSMRSYAHAIGADESAFMKAFYEVPSMSRERFGHVAQALYSLANILSRYAYQNIRHARFIAERKQKEEEFDSLKAQLQQANT